MTPETLILIALLSNGAIEWQPMQADICTAIVDQTQHGIPARGVRHDGSEISIVQGLCLSDTLALRLELEGGSLGPCGEAV